MHLNLKIQKEYKILYMNHGFLSFLSVYQINFNIKLRFELFTI